MNAGEHPGWYRIPANYFVEASGTLGVLEVGKHLPFEVRRVFWVFGVPGRTVTRGNHAHKELHQVMFCAAGTCVLDLVGVSGVRESVKLEAGEDALFVDGPVWRTMRDFTADCSLVVLCDREYWRDEVLRERQA
jgi:hypothetical protein